MIKIDNRLIYIVNGDQTTERKKICVSKPSILQRKSPRFQNKTVTKGVEGTNNVEMNTQADAVSLTIGVSASSLSCSTSKPRKFKETEFIERRSGFKTFHERIEDLKAYKALHGHTNVRKNDDTSLFNWCANMRLAKRDPKKSNALLNKGRIRALNSIGFGWDRPCQHGHGYRA